MLCYKDRTFCSFWEECAKAGSCGRELTDSVRASAKRIGLPICQFESKPRCFAGAKKVLGEEREQV